MSDNQDGGEAGFVSENAQTPVVSPEAGETIDFAIPYVRRNQFLSTEIQHWGMAFSGGSLYIFMKSRSETLTLLGTDDVDDVLDSIQGMKRKKAVKAALESGLDQVLAISDRGHRLTPDELAQVRTRRGLFRFRIMFPEMKGDKKFSLVVRNKYRKGFRQNLDKIRNAAV
jgi:hypothetical protein